MNRRNQIIMLALLLAVAVGCGGGGSSGSKRAFVDPTEPGFDAALMSTLVDNPHFPLIPGTYLVYEGVNDEGATERIEICVSHLTRRVAGVDCTIVIDRVFEDGELIEETFDWYCQDASGNVWYMGEDSREYDEGVVVGTDGSWEGGVDGAVPGILIKSTHTVGDTYQQEFYAGEAEDMAEVVGLNVLVALKNGIAYTCVKTREWTPLDPGNEEYKYYAPGIGLVLEEKIDGSEPIEILDQSLDTNLDVDPADFVASVDNPYFPLNPGTSWTYEGTTDEGEERIEVTVLPDTKVILGVNCTVVRDRAYVDDELVEETLDWYAQDADGNVWYMGEESTEYEEGVPVNMDGSWEAGVDGAVPGIIMQAEPFVGQSYRQEFYAGEAEDMGEVVGIEVPVTLSDGSQFICLQIRDWTPLEPDANEFKYYAMGIGLVLESEADGSEPLELTKISQN